VGGRISDSCHEKEGFVKTHDAAGVAKNSRGIDVWPVVNDALHQVNVRTLGYGVEEITPHNLTACRDFAGQNLGRAGHHLRQISQDTVKPWRGIKNGPEQRTLTASYVDQSLEAREVVGSQ
jgi:hypothetical protein